MDLGEIRYVKWGSFAVGKEHNGKYIRSIWR